MYSNRYSDQTGYRSVARPFACSTIKLPPPTPGRRPIIETGHGRKAYSAHPDRAGRDVLRVKHHDECATEGWVKLQLLYRLSYMQSVVWIT